MANLTNLSLTQCALRTLIQNGALGDADSALWQNMGAPQKVSDSEYRCTIQIPVILGGDANLHSPEHDFVELGVWTDRDRPHVADLWRKVRAPLAVVIGDKTQDFIDSAFRVQSGNRYVRLEPNGKDSFEVVSMQRIPVQIEYDPALGGPKLDSHLRHFCTIVEGSEMHVEGQPNGVPYHESVLVAFVDVTLGFDLAQDSLFVPAGDAQHCADLLAWAMDQITEMDDAYNDEGLPRGLAVSMPAARRFIALTTKGGAK